VAGPAGAVRAVADGVEAPCPVQQRRHLGQILAALLVTADEAGQVDWQLSIDSTVCRVHQHGLNMTREAASQLPSHTGGRIELQQTAR